MQRSVSRLLLPIMVLLALVVSAFGQVPTGTITGTVLDASGAVVPKAAITIKNKATGAERKVESSSDGTFSAPALPAGDYEITTTVQGFRTSIREVTVATGSIITLEMRLEVGQTTEIVTVEGTSSQINYESHTVDGVITRQKIQELPLNGRSFLQLAFLEPGVTVSPGTTSQYNSLFSVSILGGDSNKTAITVDGGNIRNSIEGQTGMNFSQEVVQEFQLSSANYDLSTGITSVGSVNIVTRTGGNEFHGSGYMFFRDHNMAAYPGLARNPANPEPFFVRRNPGVWVGGPIVKDRLFFFTNYEYTNQTQVYTVQPNQASVAELGGTYLSPYRGHLFSTRFDWKATDKHSVFLRYSHDENKGFGPNGGPQPPSNWLQNKNFSDQGVLGITSVFTPSLVNDFRFNYTYWQNRNLFADEDVCPGCLGLGLAQVSISGTNITLGNTSNATQGRDLRRFTFLDTLSWQKGTHRLRFGTELEYAPGTGFWGYCDPACATVASPEFVRALVPAQLIPVFFPNLPTVIRTQQDILNLPFLGGVVGVGDPAQPPAFNIDQAKKNNRIRIFGQDTWKVRPNFTLNYGLAWNFESTLVNKDLDKPALLAPLYGSDLSPTENNYKNFSPSFGFAWNVGSDNKTVLRGGAGVYWDTELLWRRLQERAFIGPRGNGRIQYPESGFINTFPGIIDLGAGGRPVPVNSPVVRSLTTMTLGQFQQIVAAQLPTVSALLAPSNPPDLSVRNIQFFKSGAQLYPSEYPVQRSYQMSLGLQRDLGHDMVLAVDFVRRVFVNTLLGELDYNRYNRFINGVRTPVIPLCRNSAEIANPNAQCSAGSITFWTPGGRSTYTAMLVKLDKRFSNRFLFTVSYALKEEKGINGIYNYDQWDASWGTQGARHLLNVSGLVDLPWGFQLGVISAFSTRGALTPSVSGLDFDGDGNTGEPIQRDRFNCYNRGCDKRDLAVAVQKWNTFLAGGKDARGQTIPTIVLPANYELGDNFSSQDVRLTKTFTFKDRLKIAVFGEMFNVFNIANLSGFNFNLISPTFGQATQRTSQVFGSGGPRALQVGGRISF
ncbi:MAG: carboxypeptidase regulatory-like domain-containing protein [Blastocatellales bacterium]